MALGHLMLGIPHHRGTVDVGGDGPAEGLIEQVILGGGGQVFAAPDHMGDAHQVVIHHVGKVIGGQPVPLQQDLVVQGAVLHGDLPEGDVGEGGAPVLGNLLADDVGFTGVQVGLDFLRGEVAAGVRFLLEGSALLFGLSLVAEAVVGVAFFHQKLGIFSIKPPALGLDVRAADVRALVMGQTALLEGAVDELCGPFYLPGLVGVFQAEDELPAGLAGDEPSVQGGAQVAHVHVTGGRRREPGADGSGGDPGLQLVIPSEIHREGLLFRSVVFLGHILKFIGRKVKVYSGDSCMAEAVVVR